MVHMSYFHTDLIRHSFLSAVSEVTHFISILLAISLKILICVLASAVDRCFYSAPEQHKGLGKLSSPSFHLIHFVTWLFYFHLAFTLFPNTDYCFLKGDAFLVTPRCHQFVCSLMLWHPTSSFHVTILLQKHIPGHCTPCIFSVWKCLSLLIFALSIELQIGRVLFRSLKGLFHGSGFLLWLSICFFFAENFIVFNIFFILFHF